MYRIKKVNKNMQATILIVEDEKNTREGLSLALEENYDVYEAGNADEAFRLMEEERFDVILTDLKMAGQSGLTVIDKAVSLKHKPICIMMTAFGNVETAVEAMKRGAYDFLTKPVSLEKLELLISRALKSKRLEKENVQLQQRLDKKYSFDEVVGSSKPFRKAIAEVKRVAPSKATVLLSGETGTGKELFAQMIHQNSPRSSKSFLAVHCAALAANLLESELFGHERGAFTGATERRIGRFEAADGGTLFLDEIGEIDASTQVKLLRFLENKTFERLGSHNTITVDVRLVCATNRDLAAMVKKGDFREDLYYRLNVVTVKLPPLRERKDDIPALIDYYVDAFSKDNGVEPVTFTKEALKALEEYPWPGNIRELRNFCENKVVMKHGEGITEYDLDIKYTVLEEKETVTPQKPTFSKEENEKRLLKNALMEAKGNRTRAAELLGISRRTLHRKLQQWPELDAR